VGTHLFGLGDHLGGVQQCLGRDAADVQAGPAQGRIALDQDHRFAQIGGTEGRSVAAGSRAENHDLGVMLAGAGRGARCRGGGR